ncbi:MAG: hypothetical protein A2519_02725 [Candidatus Raymondbacteria bacterium RIFOXYD12_FULL_49_13]|uniref:Glycoside hydrolase 123 C-terminal domain-containing protein n=1 Tax=Candidatus Raymondbacteria bacterium RIFOXYD12_FULL_49_13 TaxID=1817890 RepID=A0A1F7FF71_UNCRA|nr:MAG: hypothetical protein A2519_02725 [Candidatus Raymondbacteria bacterium RIFOXYD12_FULL_49_13]
MKVHAFDEFHKIDPRSGALYTNEGLAKTHANTLVRNKRITLRTGLNEAVGFQLVFESEKGGHFSIIPFGESIPPIQCFRVWYHKDKTRYYPDALVPISPSHFVFPSTDNRVPGQRFQAVYIEIQLAEYGATTYDFSLAVHCSGVVVGWIPVKLEVQNFRLDDSADFIFEMNHYNSPSIRFGLGRQPRAAASEEEMGTDFNFYRMAHDHRADLDILAYNAFGEICADAAPLLEGEGASIRVKDWSPFDRKYGPLLSGSAFSGCNRTLRIKQFYLPFFENWPLSFKKYYKVNVNERQEYLTVMHEHRTKETRIEEDIDPVYRQGVKNIIREFILHFEEKGWTDVIVFYFFNNKYYWRGSPHREGKDVSSWWLLDEPFYYSDWRALRFFGSMLNEVKRELGGKGKNFLFRIDVSWQSQYHHFDGGILDVNVASAKNGLDNGWWYRKRSLLFNERFWKYGEGNPLNEPDTNTYANIMRHYAWHGEGFLPWNSVSGNSAFDEADVLAIIYHGMRFGVKGPIASLRLKTIRRVMQDLQYVHQAAVKQGVDRIAEGHVIETLINTEATAHMENTLAAGSTRSAMKIWEPAVLRESLRRYL